MWTGYNLGRGNIYYSSKLLNLIVINVKGVRSVGSKSEAQMAE